MRLRNHHQVSCEKSDLAAGFDRSFFAGNPGRDITITSNPLLLAAAAAAASSSSSSATTGGVVHSNGINFGANNNIVLSSLQNQSHSTPNQINQSQFLLTRFMQPTLDDSDMAQLERSRAER